MKDGSRFILAEHKIDSILETIRNHSLQILPEDDTRLKAFADLSDAMNELRAAHDEIDAQREELDRACDNVQREHDRYAELFENAPDGYVVTDLHGIVKQANRSFAEMVELQRDFSVGMPLARFVFSDDNKEYFRQLGRIYNLGSARDWELRFQHRDGTIIWTSINIATVSDSEGPGLRWLIRDISARKRFEDVLRRYELLSTYTRDIILFIRGDDGRVLEANTAAVKAYGYSHEELLALSIEDLRAHNARSEMSEQKAKAQSEGILFETVHQRRDGSIFPVEVSSRGEMIGGVQTLVSVIRDITRRKQTEAIIHARLTLLEFAASHSTEELLVKAIDEIGSLTMSSIGFFHFVNKDQNALSLQTWSTKTVEQFCSAEGKGKHYPIEAAGVWVDYIHAKAPVIHNDYASLPHHKGLPDGHPPVTREMVVPIMRSGRVVAILGVGNKPDDYTLEDVEVAAYLADVAWEITSRKVAEDQLRKAYDNLHTTLESITDGFFSVDREWGITYMNKSGAKMLGFETDDPLGKVLWELFPKAVDLEFYRLYHLAAESNSPVHFEEYYPAPLRKWWECHAYPSSDGLSVYFRDITERKLLEETRLYLAHCCWSSNDEFFQSLARHLAESLSMDFVCIDVLDEDNLSATTLAVYYDGKFEDNLTYTLKDTPCGKLVEKKVCCFERGVRHLFPDDIVLQEMKAESYVGTTLRNTHEKPIGLIALIGREPLSNLRLAEAVLQLVSIRAAGELQRKLTDNALRESEEKFRALFESMSEGVALHELVYDLSGRAVDYRILSINPAYEEHTGLRWADVVGRLAGEIYGTGDAPFLEKYAAVAEFDQKLSFETPFPPLGRHFLVSATSPKKGQFLSVFEDITERKKMEEELRQSHDRLESQVQERTTALRLSNQTLREHAASLERLNEELQEFAFIASHDLQEPLRKIQTFGNLLSGKMGEEVACERRDYLDRIIGSAARMSDLLHSLLNYSSMVSIPHRSGPVDLAEVARQVMMDLELSIKESEATVEIGNLPEIEADDSQMRQLFQNLIANSIKYRKETAKPLVKIHGGTIGGICKIFVQDNGIGFEEQYLDRIFKPFQQLHNKKSKYGGTGMGLAICRKIAERHGGKISARSSPGHGATFIIEIPVKHADAAEK
jgi:PAS domain S-box-containing protein